MLTLIYEVNIKISNSQAFYFNKKRSASRREGKTDLLSGGMAPPVRTGATLKWRE
jgi:hypothetical protein